MTDEEIKEKFRRLSILTLDRVQSEQIIEKVYVIENVKSTKELMQTLTK